MELLFVTGNPNKTLELEQILDGHIKVASVSLDLPEIQGSIKEIAIAKARKAFKLPVLVEDTSLIFSAYKTELPGPYIKWFLSSLGSEGICKMLDGFDDRSAEAVCTFAYCWDAEKEPLIFQGRCKGTIALRPQGVSTFGWDSCFIPALNGNNEKNHQR